MRPVKTITNNPFGLSACHRPVLALDKRIDKNTGNSNALFGMHY